MVIVMCDVCNAMRASSPSLLQRQRPGRGTRHQRRPNTCERVTRQWLDWSTVLVVVVVAVAVMMLLLVAMLLVLGKDVAADIDAHYSDSVGSKWSHERGEV